LFEPALELVASMTMHDAVKPAVSRQPRLLAALLGRATSGKVKDAILYTLARLGCGQYDTVIHVGRTLVPAFEVALVSANDGIVLAALEAVQNLARLVTELMDWKFNPLFFFFFFFFGGGGGGGVTDRAVILAPEETKKRKEELRRNMRRSALESIITGLAGHQTPAVVVAAAATMPLLESLNPGAQEENKRQVAA
jgi:hypothetical protein